MAAGLAALVLAFGARPAAAAAAVAAPVWAVVQLDQIFRGLSYFPVLYFIPLMFLPRWKLTKMLGKSQLPFLALGVVYLYCAMAAVHYSKDLLPFVKELLTGQATLGKWHAVLASDSIVGAKALYAWAGIKIANVFVGRHIYLDSLQSKTFAFHSMLACLCINGAVGYFLHLLTKLVLGRFDEGLVECVEEDDAMPEQF